MYVNDNKIHGSHGVHNQIESLHHFVQGIVRTLPPANHDGALTQGTIGNLMYKAVNDKRNALVHQLVQIGRNTCHFRHHANLQNRQNSFFQRQGHEKNVVQKLTHRQPVIYHTMAMVATIFPGGMQSHHHLVPPPIFAQVLGKPCQGAFGQPFQLSHHLLTFVHGVKTVHPKHNLNLDFQRQHAAKRLVSGVH